MSNNEAPALEEVHQGFHLKAYAVQTPCGTFRGRLVISPTNGENDLPVRDSLVEYHSVTEAAQHALRSGFEHVEAELAKRLWCDAFAVALSELWKGLHEPWGPGEAAQDMWPTMKHVEPRAAAGRYFYDQLPKRRQG